MPRVSIMFPHECQVSSAAADETWQPKIILQPQLCTNRIENPETGSLSHLSQVAARLLNSLINSVPACSELTGIHNLSTTPSKLRTIPS